MLQPVTLVRYSLRGFDRVYTQVFQNRHLLFLLLSLQLLWLAAIAWTGTSTNWSKLLILTVYSVLASVVVTLLPAAYVRRLHEFKEWMLQKQRRVLFILCLVALIVGAFYASQQVPWSDEGRSLVAAQTLVSEGLEASYRESGWLRNKHPPLIPLLYSLTLTLPGASLFYLRFVSVLFLMATAAIIYLLGRDLYGQETGYLASLLFLSFPLAIRLGASAIMDMQLAFFFTLALLLSLRLLRSPSYRLAVVIGIVIGLGLLTKYIMVFIYGVLLGYAVFRPDLRRLKYHLVIALLISMSILALWLFYTYQTGILSGQFNKIISYSGIFHVLRDLDGYGQSQADALAAGAEPAVNAIKSRIMQIGLETLFTRLPSSLGIHHLPLILFGAMSLLRRRKAADLFVLFWIGSVFGALFLTLPDHRYFLISFPAIAMVIARSFKRIPEGAERALLLCLLFGGGNLYLFVDWVREAHLFLLPL